MGSAVPVATFDHCRPLAVVPEMIVGWTKVAAWAARPERSRARNAAGSQRGVGSLEICEDFMAAEMLCVSVKSTQVFTFLSLHPIKESASQQVGKKKCVKSCTSNARGGGRECAESANGLWNRRHARAMMSARQRLSQIKGRRAAGVPFLRRSRLSFCSRGARPPSGAPTRALAGWLGEICGRRPVVFPTRRARGGPDSARGGMGAVPGTGRRFQRLKFGR